MMIESSFNATKASIDAARNEVEVHRLQNLSDRNQIEADKAEIAFQRQLLEQEKKEFEEGGTKMVAATAGQAMLVEEEVKKRLREERAREEYERNAQKQGGIDNDVRMLQTFNEMRERVKINYDNVTDEDALADSMLAVDSLEKKKILMRYKRLK